jgi:hypothetical protein
VKAQCFAEPVLPLEMRIFTKFAPDPTKIPADVIVARSASPRLAFRLMRALIGLGMTALSSRGR